MDLLPHVTSFLSESVDEEQFIARMNLFQDFGRFNVATITDAIITLNKAVNLMELQQQYTMNDMEPHQKSQTRQIFIASPKAVALAAILTFEENRKLHKVLTDARKIRRLFERMSTNTC